ncbi:MAG: hypothetical protein IT466_04475 [Moraxellaceae bacterium]|nr:hypothetical protein [Moraxellaceae bacterium]
MKQTNLNDCLRFDVRELARGGALRAGHACTWSWFSNGERVSRVGIEAAFDSIRLTYLADGQPKNYRIKIEHTICHYGGTRPWFSCPCCDRRAAVLYSRGAFVCRQCTTLNYASQNEAARWRTNSAAWKLRFALGIKVGDIRPPHLIPKAKGRHWKTHWRMIDRLQRLEGISISNTQKWLAKLNGHG